MEGTLGPRHAQPTNTLPTLTQLPQASLTPPRGPDPYAMVGQLASVMGKELITAMRPVVEAQSIAVKAQQTKATKGKTYDDYELAWIRGWSGVESLRHIQPIWRQFQATKSLQTQRDHIRDKMKMWVDKFNFEIDPSPYFDKETIEDIINLRLTGGGPIAAFKSTE